MYAIGTISKKKPSPPRPWPSAKRSKTLGTTEAATVITARAAVQIHSHLAPGAGARSGWPTFP